MATSPHDQMSTCALWSDCHGRAKMRSARGFLRIDDAIQQKRRVGRHTWLAEMLCEQPNRADCVYEEFEPSVHVFDDDALDANATAVQWVGGIDFGYHDPTVLLWGCVDEEGVLMVVDELVERNQLAERFIEQAEARSGAAHVRRPGWVGADPAGHQRSSHTGVSTIALWKRNGWTMRTRGLRIEAGIEAVRRRLRFADESVGLRIHARCGELIRSMKCYHYDSNRPDSSSPVKDGSDHAADALRYMIVNLDCAARRAQVRPY